MIHHLMPSILVVEDEEAIITMLRYNLERNNYIVHVAYDGEEALIMAEEMRPDIILLDWMLPGMSGVEICQKIRATQGIESTPIVMLTAKGEEKDKIVGLDSGADDYIVKPFSPNELVSRIKAIFRRMRPAFSEKTLVFGDVVMDLTSYNVTRNGREIHLGPTEFRILQCLMEYPKRILSRETILVQVWGYDSDIEARTVDVHINRLRSALKGSGEEESFIWTVRSAGYCLQKPSRN